MTQGGVQETHSEGLTHDRGILPELAGFNLRIAYGLASQLFLAHFETMDLAPLQFAALEFISNAGGRSQTEIAERIGTAPSVLVAPLERLERRRLIKRTRDPRDRRRAVVGITPEGTKLLLRARAEVTLVEEKLMDGLDPWERGQLIDLLRKLVDR